MADNNIKVVPETVQPYDSTSTTSIKDNHLQRTVDQTREPKTITMEIIKIADISSTVKHLVLHTKERPIPISFKAGQWVDMSIPGVDTVGGFSICSSPIHLSQTGELSLSIKNSDHPPAAWVHNKCKQGSTVTIRVGGDFFLDTDNPEMSGKNILLVAGGVGINPLASINAQLQDYRKNIAKYNLNTCLMFSAKTTAELLFLDSFKEAMLEDATFSVQCFVTDGEELDKITTEENSIIKYGRITKSDIVRCLTSNLNLHIGSEDLNDKVLVYVCGPPPMIQDVQDVIVSLGIKNIFYEKWW